MTLKLLDESARSRLRSGVAIRSMSHCVGELVENSIDAGATCIAVRVDTTKFKIQVVDNGRGISHEDLSLLGERYMTSKCHTVNDLEHNLHYLGYRGEALASVVNVSGIVEICSRHCLSRDTYSRMFHNGKPMNVMLSKTHRPSVGTTITVHEFFYNMPVRRKVLSAALELEQVKKAIECIALVNPSKSFSIRNDITGECILQTHKTYSVLTNFGLIFGGDKVANMKEVKYTHGDFVLTGYMSTVGHYNKSLQFIYVNGHIVKKTPLHSTVNTLLANSLLSRKLSKQTRDQTSQDQLTSPKRVVETHGVYILLLKCSRAAYDVCLEPAKTLIEFQDWSEVLLTFETLVKEFLSKHNLTLGPAAVPNQAEGDKRGAPQNPHCDSAMEVKQLSRVSADDSQTCSTRESVNILLLEMHSSLQSKVVKHPKKFCQQQTRRGISGSATEEPSTMQDSCLTTVQDGDNLPTLHSQQTDQPPGVTLCVARLQSEVEHHDSSNKSMSIENLQQTSCFSSTTITQPGNANVTLTNGGIKPIFHPHVSQSTAVCNFREVISLESSSQDVLPRPLSCTRSNLDQTPNSLFLTSFYSQASRTPKEQVTVTESQSKASSYRNTQEHSQGTSTTAQPKLQTYSHHPMQLVSSTSVPYQKLPRDGPRSTCSLPSAKKIALGLNVPVRSPLQSSPGSTKLAQLFQRGQKTRRESVSRVTQLSNLRQDLRRSQPDSLHLTHLSKTSELLAPTSIADTNHLQPVLNPHCVVSTCALQPPLSVPMQNNTITTQNCVTTDCDVVESISTVLGNHATDVETSWGGEPPLVLNDTSLSPRLTALIGPTAEVNFHSADSNDDGLNIESRELLSTSSSPVTVHSSDSVNHLNPERTCSSETNNLTDTCSNAVLNFLSQSELEHKPCTDYLTCALELANDHTDNQQETNTDDGISDSMSEYNAETTSQAVSVDEGATSKLIWKECIDPMSKKKVYIHSKTGNVCTSIPTECILSHSLLPPPVLHLEHCDSLSTMNPEDSGLGDSLSLDSSSVSLHSTSSDNTSSATLTFGAKPLRAAPHLSHDFESFLPRPKHLRTSFASSENLLDSTNTTLESILSEPCGADTVGSKWRNNEEVDELHLKEGASSENSFAALLEQWENPTFQPGDMDVLNVARDGRQRGQVKVHQVINRYKFTKEMFGNFKVLGQVDSKFITCLLDTKNNGVHDLVVMIDQHAAHERVRLEELLNNLYESRQENSQPLRIKSSQIHPPMSISLQPTEIRLAKLFRQQLEATGVSLLFDRGHVRVSSLPSVLMEREASEVKRGRPAVAATLLQEMIIKHLELLQTTSGGCSAIPSALINVLNSQACHGAIKFGDPLTFGECESLIQSLSQCKLPFQCAHGRPSLIPIVDLNILNQRYPVSQVAPHRPNFKKLRDHQQSDSNAK